MFELQAIHKLHLPNRFFPPRQTGAGELTRLFVFLWQLTPQSPAASWRGGGRADSGFLLLARDGAARDAAPRRAWLSLRRTRWCYRCTQTSQGAASQFRFAPGGYVPPFSGSRRKVLPAIDAWAAYP